MTRRYPMSEPVPLSLQWQCFSYIAHHLEEFPAEVLALLPVRVREELLVMLAPADIFQLEGGKATEGVDMNRVWEAMKKRTRPCISESLTFVDFTGVLPFEWQTSIFSDPREYVNFIAGYLLFHKPSHTSRRCCFFSVLQGSAVLSLITDRVSMVPHRYKRFFPERGNCQAIMRDTAAFLLHRCRITLSRLFCSVHRFFLQLESVPLEMMQEIFGCLEEICFNWYDLKLIGAAYPRTDVPSIDDNVRVFSSVLSAALTHSSASFRTLILRDLPPDDKHFMKRAAELFSKAQDYPGLQHLRIRTKHCEHGFFNEMLASEHLKKVLDIFRNSLQELYIERWWLSFTGPIRRHQDLYQSICSLMRMPQFAKLSLFGSGLTSKIVYELLRAFLQSSCQELHMAQNYIARSSAVPALSIEMAEDACKYKRINLLPLKYPLLRNVCFPMVVSLLRDVHKLRLKSLKTLHASTHLLVESIVHHEDALVEEIQVLCYSPDIYREGCTSKQARALLILASKRNLEKAVITCNFQRKLHPEIASFQQRLGFDLRITYDYYMYYEFTLSGFQFGVAPTHLEDFLKMLFSQLSIKHVLFCFS